MVLRSSQQVFSEISIHVSNALAPGNPDTLEQNPSLSFGKIQI